MFWLCDLVQILEIWLLSLSNKSGLMTSNDHSNPGRCPIEVTYILEPLQFQANPQNHLPQLQTSDRSSCKLAPDVCVFYLILSLFSVRVVINFRFCGSTCPCIVSHLQRPNQDAGWMGWLCINTAQFRTVDLPKTGLFPLGNGVFLSKYVMCI